MIKEKQKYQSGFTILETIVVLIVMVSALSAGAVYMKYNADNSLNRSAADSLMQLTKAVQWYARDNFSMLKASSNSSVSLDILEKGKYIGAGFSPKNSYGQSYSITIDPEAVNEDNTALKILIITQNGETLKVDSMRKIAALAGNDIGYAIQAGTVTGNQGSWNINTGISAGRMASVSYVAEKDIVSAETFLRRDKFEGHSEWNQMNTDLGMGDNSINFEDGAIVFKHDNYDATLAANGAMFSHQSDKTEIAAEGIQLSNGSANVAGSTMSAQSVKPGVTILNAGQNMIFEADNICVNESEEAVGRTFVMGFNGDNRRYTFMCGKNDGDSTIDTKGRAYYVFGTGNNSAEGNENTECEGYKYWIPSNIGSTSPTDNKTSACILRVSSDGRAITFTYLDFVGSGEARNYYTRTVVPFGCKSNRYTQYSNYCDIVTVTIFEKYPGEKIEHPGNHRYCNASGIGSNTHNIYIRDPVTGIWDDCKRVKYHQ
ncbi:MAG TPA: hypothetical protein VGL07_13280 [Buttiauxella sp.]